jgi:hypothetical protein
MLKQKSVMLASLATGVIPSVWFAVYQTRAEYPLFTDAAGVVEFSLLVYCYAVGIAFACGCATLWLFSRLARFSWWAASLAGLSWGILLGYLFGGREIKLTPLLDWAAIGGICGFTFWTVWWYITRREYSK